MADVPAGVACKVHFSIPIVIARSFGASAHRSRFEWLRIAICPS